MTAGLKLTAYLGERMRTGGRFAADAALDVLAGHNVANSVLLRGRSGFGARQVLRTDQTLSLSEDPPIVIAALDSAEVISAAAPDVAAAIPRGLLTVERVVLGDAGDDGHDVRLTVALGRNQRINGRPAFVWICELMHRHGFAGATAYLGVDGTSAGRRRRARFFSRNAEVPLEIVGVGAAGPSHDVLAHLRDALPNAVLAVEKVQICRRDGELLATPEPLPDRDSRGRLLHQKLTVHTAEDTLHDGVPIHRALVRLLRSRRAAAGATAVGGVWGFHGRHAPHGDRLFALGRGVPVSTVVVDTPAAVAVSYALVEEVTGRHGLVTVETVPAVLALDGRPATLDLADYPG